MSATSEQQRDDRIVLRVITDTEDWLTLRAVNDATLSISVYQVADALDRLMECGAVEHGSIAGLTYYRATA